MTILEMRDALLAHAGHGPTSVPKDSEESPPLDIVLHFCVEGKRSIDDVRSAFESVIRVYLKLSDLHASPDNVSERLPIGDNILRDVSTASFAIVMSLADAAQRMSLDGQDERASELREYAAGVSMTAYLLLSGGHEELGKDLFYDARARGRSMLADVVLRSLPTSDRETIARAVRGG